MLSWLSFPKTGVFALQVKAIKLLVDHHEEILPAAVVPALQASCNAQLPWQTIAVPSDSCVSRSQAAMHNTVTIPPVLCTVHHCASSKTALKLFIPDAATLCCRRLRRRQRGRTMQRSRRGGENASSATWTGSSGGMPTLAQTLPGCRYADEACACMAPYSSLSGAPSGPLRHAGWPRMLSPTVLGAVSLVTNSCNCSA